MPERYGVVGHPIDHSRSPEIHRRFAEQTGEAISYEALEAPLDGLAQTVADFVKRGGRGLNVTLPFKVSVLPLCDELGAEARAVRSVNTLSFDRSGRCRGDTTDGIGFIRDLRDNLHFDPTSRQLLILGAGGVVRALLGELVRSKPERIALANRTLANAQALLRELDCPTPVCSLPLEALPEAGPFDLIINTIPAGIPTRLPGGLLAPGGSCYDVNYACEATPLMRWGLENGAHWVADGLGMLVEQAAESFAIWRGRRPRTAAVLEALRQSRKTTRQS